jgi:hypothetical protein
VQKIVQPIFRKVKAIIVKRIKIDAIEESIMNLMKKMAVVVLASVLAAGAMVMPASAGSREDDALIGGVVGLATGVILGSAITNQPNNRTIYVDRDSRRPSVYDDRYEYNHYRAPRRDGYIEYYRKNVIPSYREPYGVKRVSVEPWTGAWFDYCSSRYRSFNPRTGTYVGHDGKSRFCIGR